MQNVSISVIIPVKNEAAKIRACIEGILSQSIAVEEIIVLDSGSTDGTLDILKEYEKVKIVHINPNEFNHGETRNVGVRHAKGAFLLLTVGDARPYDEDWIKKMLEGFSSEDVMAVCGKQVVPHEIDKNPAEWYRPVSKSGIRTLKFTREELAALSPAELKNACGWDDVTALYKATALKEIPFQVTSYSEDAIWAKDALSKGYTIAYNPEAMVYHYHLENKDFTFKRTLTTLYFRYRHFGFIPPKPAMGFIDLLRLIKVVWISGPMTNRQKIKWVKYNLDMHNAAKAAYRLFTDALAISEDNLTKVHTEYCGKPPIPVKK